MYHYTESGLRDVWLANGYRMVETPYGTGVAIEDVDGLHRAIATGLAGKAGRLTGAEFRFLRKEQELSQKSLAALVGCTVQQINRWETGKIRVPRWADRVVRVIYREYASGDARFRGFVDRLNEAEARRQEAPARRVHRFARRGGWREAA